MNRNLEKSHHIDYAFLSNDLLQTANISIGNPSKWLQFSDHMPVLVDIKILKISTRPTLSRDVRLLS